MDFARSRAVIPTERKKAENQQIFGLFSFYIAQNGWVVVDVLVDAKSKPRSKPKIMDATISVVCYKSKMLSNGEYPLMVRVAVNT